MHLKLTLGKLGFMYLCTYYLGMFIVICKCEWIYMIILFLLKHVHINKKSKSSFKPFFNHV